MHHLLSRDRSREPLDLTDLGLSLDNIQPVHSHTRNSKNASPNLNKIEPTMTSSMPELTAKEIQCHDVSVMTTPEDLPSKNNLNDNIQENTELPIETNGMISKN